MSTTAPSSESLLQARPQPPSVYQNFVDGKWIHSAATRRSPNLNPADVGEVLGEVPLSTADETNRAVEAAARAFPAWRATPGPKRGQILWKAYQIMEERKNELAARLTLEEGKIFNEAVGEVVKSLNVLEFMAGEGRRLAGETLPSELPSTFCYTVRQPLGVVAVITPWNFPVAIPVWKIAPALVSGNTVVFKPATLTPWTATEVVRIFEEAGLPPGVLNMVLGSGSEVGSALLSHPEVKAVSFTGSNEVGTQVYVDGARRLLKVQCEMGGKNPVVVLEDADLDLAAEGTVQGAFGSTGQRCTATSRVVVMDSVADAFVERVVAKAAQVKPGFGLKAGVTMGPSVDDKQLGTVLQYLDIGRQEGARLLCGGARLESEGLGKGYFPAPTVFDRVKPEMRVAQEEIFGPVLSVLRVSTFEEAMKVANGVRFGLSSSIYTNDASRMFRFLDGIDTGITHVNSPTMGGEAHLPFGGMKGTGVGTREQGRVAIDFFTELKTAYIDYTGRKRETNIY